MRASTGHLLVFSLAALALGPLWWHTMAITKADIRIRGVCAKRDAQLPAPPAPWARADAPVDLPWTDDAAADAMLAAYPPRTVFTLHSDASPPRVVLGSRHQAWVLGNESLVARTLDLVASWTPTPPLAVRFFVALTEAPSAAEAAAVAAVLHALRPHVDSVHMAWSSRSHASPAAAVPASDKLIEVRGAHAAAQLRSALGFAPLPSGMRVVGDAPQWQVERWAAHHAVRLCVSARATVRVLPTGVTVAPDAVAVPPREAFAQAEAAYHHPDALALLYFPSDHKAAVYLPVFFPAAFAMLSVWINWLRGQ